MDPSRRDLGRQVRQLGFGVAVSDHDGTNNGYNTRIAYTVTPPDDNGLAISRYDFDVTGGLAADAPRT